jgi:glucan phosphoethanolaminetransferase (alkaline phosphatase superfamily)
MKVTPRKIFASWWFITLVVIAIIIIVVIIMKDMASNASNNAANNNNTIAPANTVPWVNNGATPNANNSQANNTQQQTPPQKAGAIDPATGFPYADETNTLGEDPNSGTVNPYTGTNGAINPDFPND